MFETKGSLDSAKRKLTYITKLIGKPRREQPNIISSVAPNEPTDLSANLCDAELKKAQALMRWHVLNHPT